MRIAAVVLAAGEGRRMGGRPKALLRVADSSFLARACTLIQRPGVETVIAVLGQDSSRVAAEAGISPGVHVVENPDHRLGMLSSVLRGLEEAESRGADAVLLHPVDHPLVDPTTVDRVVEALGSGAWVAVPTHAGRRGHPGGFARPSWPALRSASPERGARAVLAEHPGWVVHVPGDSRCVEGIDTPADYARLLGLGDPWLPLKAAR